jgi:translocation and assembly module TamB
MVKKILIKIFKILGWIVAGIVVLLLLVIGAIQIPSVQNKIVHKGVGFLQKKIGTPVSLAHFSLRFPKEIVLTGLYLEDQKKDTLLYAGEIAINTDLWGLLHHRIQLNDVSLEKITANISRSKQDSAFNFDYIIKAFAGDSIATPKDTTAIVAWKFLLYDAEISKAHLVYDDLYSGNSVKFDIGTLEVDMDEMDLDSSIYKVDELLLSDVKANILQTQITEGNADQQESSDSKPLDIGLNEATLKNLHVKYSQQALGQFIQLDLGNALLKSDDIDLVKKQIALDKFSLENTFISYQQMARNERPAIEIVKDTLVSNSDDEPWQVSLNNLTLSGNSFQYYDFNKPTIKNGIDFNHLWISQFNTQAEDLKLKGSEMEGKLAKMTFHEKSGFGVKTFQTDFKLSNTNAEITDFIFETGNSKIAFSAQADFNSLDNIAKEYARAKVKLNIDKTFLSARDILFFQPHAFDSIPLKNPKALKVFLDGHAHGTVSDLSIDDVVLRTLSQTTVNMSGNVKGLPDIKMARMSIALEKFYTTDNDIRNLLVDSLMPKSLRMPEWINVVADLRGTLKTPDIHSVLTSSIGSVNLNAKMDLDSTSKNQGYNGEVSIKDFHVGKLLNQPQTMGQLNMTASVKGTGTTAETINALLDMTIYNFQYQGYNYENFKLNGALKKYFFTGTALLEDENLDFNLDGGFNFNEEVPAYRFKFDLKNADFKALHLSERPLRARGTLEVDLATSDFKVINGSLDIRKVAIYNGEKLYTVDSLLFASIDQQGKTDIKIDSDLLKGNFTGTINLFSLPDVLTKYFDTYFSLKNVANTKKSNEVQQFEFNLELKKTELITDILLPELVSFEPGPLHGEFNSANNNLFVRMSMGKIQYSNIATDSFLINVNSTKKSLNYNVYLQNVRIDSLLIYGLELDGSVANDSIKTIFAVRDSLQEKQYKLGGMFYSRSDDFQFKFLPDLVVLNYEHWRVPVDNYINFGEKGIMTHNLFIGLNEQKLFVETKSDKDSTLLIGFRSLYLANISGMLAANKTLVAGSLNGDVNILRAKQNAIDAKVNIHGLTILRQLWGEVALDVKRTSADRFDMNLSVDGINTDIKTAGYYAVTESSSSIDVKTTIEKLDISLIEPLTVGQLKDMTGMLTGNIDVTGDLKQPKILGGITFKDVRFTSTYVNTGFALSNETINFSDPGLVFKNFKIKDVNNNVATINGSVNTASFSNLILDLRLDARDFRVLNTTVKDNELFYGKVGLNTTARITGTATIPVVDVRIGLSDDSDFTYIVPQSDKGVLDQTGIVTFIDKDAVNDPFLSSINMKDTIKNNYGGMYLSANIELNDKETFNIVIDPATGDKLSVQGNTTLTFKMDPMGNMELVGRYEISRGTYNLSFYKLVKRQFEIEKGSTILWSGDPLNATMDLRAIYKVETSPLELVSNQLGSQEEMNQYKQRIPFLVFLNIKGELLIPEISFKLDMPLEKRNAFAGNVYAKIQDINTRESDLNKQVFSLLLLKRFMTDNPFESQSGSGFEGTARTSVSKMLTEQLNRLSENVKGVQLSFDLKSYEDYSSGQASGQTSLQLGLSKNLLNDRLVVKLSGNVDIEGENTNQSSLTDYIGDLALEYKLTPDGRLRITGFRNSDYDMIDGELVRTGAGLIYIKDYNAFRELFRSNAKQNSNF